MRVVSGAYGGRVLVAPKGGGTRPMTDKARAALFDALGDISGKIVLDAYAGSGAVGFEALSRGASQVVAIESARPAIAAIKANQAALELSWGYSLHPTTVESWLARQDAIGANPFDLIIADPPYARLRPDILEHLGMLLRSDGLLAVSHSNRHPELELAGLQLIERKHYGDTAIGFYKPQ